MAKLNKMSISLEVFISKFLEGLVFFYTAYVNNMMMPCSIEVPEGEIFRLDSDYI